LPPLTRRRFLLSSAAIAASGALAIGADGAIFEPTHLQVVELEIRLKRLPEAWDGFRIVQMSDFHYDEFFSALPIGRSVPIVNRLQPDLVVLTGDFVTMQPFARHFRRRRAHVAETAAPCAKLLSPLRAPWGIFACLGNHDASCDPERITAILEAHGIPVLNNSSTALKRGRSRLWLAGLDDVLDGGPDVRLALKGIPAGEPVILLSHEPDFATYVSRFPVDLQLSGHSHGGQIRLPLIGAPILPPLARRYPWGLHQLGDLTLYTNIGIGTVEVPIRLNCPPEITLITLRAGGGAGKTERG
jgi:predicted MPP superfamily phosphohydrolase